MKDSDDVNEIFFLSKKNILWKIERNKNNKIHVCEYLTLKTILITYSNNSAVKYLSL